MAVSRPYPMGPNEKAALERARQELRCMPNKSPWEARFLDELEQQLGSSSPPTEENKDDSTVR